jgi:hypothetical protein
MNGEKEWNDTEVEEYLKLVRRVLTQIRSALPATSEEVVAVLLDKILPPLYYWREEQRRAAAAGATGAPGTNGARAPQGAAQAPPVKEDNREAVLNGLKWHPMKNGSGEWAFAVDREGSPRPGLAPILEELKAAGRRLRVGDHEYELSGNGGKFLHRFPLKS